MTEQDIPGADADGGADHPVSVDDMARRVDAAMARLEAMDLDGALATFAEVEAALRYSRDPAARVQWARTLNGLGFIELMDAKEARAAAGPTVPDGGDPASESEFDRSLKQALARFEQALTIQTVPLYRSFVEGNKAYVLALLGRPEPAGELLRRLFRDGGRGYYDGQMKDTERRPIPEDRAVRRLLDDLWEETNR